MPFNPLFLSELGLDGFWLCCLVDRIHPDTIRGGCLLVGVRQHVVVHLFVLRQIDILYALRLAVVGEVLVLGVVIVIGHAIEKIVEVDHLLLFLVGGGLGTLNRLIVLFLTLDLAKILLELLAVFFGKRLLFRLLIERRVGGGAVSERVANNELLAIFEEVL